MKSLYVLFVCALSITISSCFQNSNSAKNIIQLRQAAEFASKTFPIEVDFVTTAVSCEFKAPDTIQYNYTVDLDLDRILASEYNEMMQENITYQTINHMNISKATALKKLQPVLVHNYKTKEGKKLCEVKVTPEMYDKKPAVRILSDNEMYKSLDRMARIYNTKQGFYFDDETVLKEVRAIHPRSLEYSYSLTTTSLSEIDVELFSKLVKSDIVESLKSDSESEDKLLRDNNVIYRFSYYDKDSYFITVVDVLPSDYKRTK